MQKSLTALDDTGEQSGPLVTGVDSLVLERHVGDVGQHFALGAGMSSDLLPDSRRTRALPEKHHLNDGLAGVPS
jgi:capsule polysaccharide export protein KpsC/LpsZ